MCVCLDSPPDSTPIVLQNLSLFLQQVNLSNVLLGDCNVNYLDTSSSLYFLLHSILCSFDLTQVVREPTRLATSGTATLIDLALMSNPSSLEVCSVIPPLSNSDHNGVSLTIKWKIENRKSRYRKIWKYLQADFQRACGLINATDWDTLL